MRYGLIATESDDPGHLHLIWGWLDDFLDGTEYIMAADTGLGQAAAGYIVNRTPGAKHTTLFKPQEKIELVHYDEESVGHGEDLIGEVS